MFAIIVSAVLLIFGAVEGIKVPQDQIKVLCEQNGYKLYTTGCYKLHDVSVSWDTARGKCAEEGAHLVIINDSAEADVVNIVAKDSSGFYDWVGLRDENGNDNWKSINGDRIEDLYHVWAESYTYTGKHKCGALKYTGELDDLPCHSERSFICEK